MANTKKLKAFFKDDTLSMAKKLLGQTLIYRTPQGIIKAAINETEAYTEEDPACHAYQGRRITRTETMFLQPGHLYVYFIYGMHHCANIVTEEAGRGCAVS